MGERPSTVDKLSLKNRVRAQLSESAKLKRYVSQQCLDAILEAAEMIASSLKAGGKLLLCGNGGSAADCQHIAAEFVNRLSVSFGRAALPAIALTADTSVITAGGNDYGFECIFERQIEALGRPGDVLLAISTSGKSENVVRAAQRARTSQMKVIGLLGQGGGKLADVVNIPIIVPSNNVPRIQEAHLTVGHIVCDVVERTLFSQIDFGTSESCQE